MLTYARLHRYPVLVNLLPLLAIYAAVVIGFSTAGLQMDEGRYLTLASNLLHGRYAPAGTQALPSGPGYPLVLLPFVAAHVPLIVLRLLNAVFIYLAVYYFCRLLALYVRARRCLLGAYLLGLYPPLFRLLPVLMTESLSFFLTCAAAYHCSASLHQPLTDPCSMVSPRRPCRLLLCHVAAAGFFLGWLALTRVFFGYVLTVCLAVALIVALYRKSLRAKRAATICGLALLFCAPYLLYTYSLTGRLFCWSTIGGASLYWMASPYEGDLGDWHGNSIADLERIAPSSSPSLLTNHAQFFRSLSTMTEPEVDRRLRSRGLYNIAHYPTRFLENWVANWGRLLIGYPYSYTLEKLSSFLYMLPNMLLLSVALFSAWATAAAWRRVPAEAFPLLVFLGMSLVGSSLLSAYSRQFTPLVPLLMTWIGIVLDRVAKIEVVT